MANRHFYILLILGLTLESCSKTVSVKAFVSYVNDTSNGLVKVTRAENYNYELKYRPTTFMVVNELRKEQVGESEFEKVKKDYMDMLYFNLRVNSNDLSTELLRSNSSNQQEYFERIKYYADNVQEDIKLVNGTDTLSCAIHHFERTYKMTPYVNIMCVFEKPKELLDNWEVIYSDNLFMTGEQHFPFATNSLKNIPDIELN